MSVETWTYILVGLTFAGYLYIGYLNRVRDTKGFYVAGQGVPAIFNGAATAADWMSAASFISMAGLISFMGFDGAVYLMGWTGGYVLLALLLAPYLRKYGKYTVPDFVGDRYYSTTARLVAAIAAIFVSLTYVAGQMRGVGVVFSRFLGVPITWGVIIGMAVVAFFAVLGGMKGITWTQVAQYSVLIFAYLIPAVAIAQKLTGNPIPQLSFTFSDITARLNQIQVDLGFSEYTQPFQTKPMLDIFCITAALMVGTAGLPHILVRFYTVPNVRAARYSTGWALLFIALLYTTAPAIAAFARYNLIDTLHGKSLEEIQSLSPLVRPPAGHRPSAEAIRIHHILPQELDTAPTLDRVLPKILQRLSVGVALVHYAKLDIGFLRRACRDLGLSWPRPRVVDTVRLLSRLSHRRRQLTPYADPLPTDLVKARRVFDLPDHLAHHALCDALATAELFLVLRSALEARRLRHLT